MEFRVLGPVTAGPAASEGSFGSPKERGVLAHLLARANEVVSVEALIEGLWGEDTPASAERTLHAYIARLRRRLDDQSARNGHHLQTVGRGYVLRVPDRNLDAAVFERLALAGRQRLNASDPYAAASLLVAALSLWQGTPYAGLDSTPWGHVEAERLKELQSIAIEDKIAAELALGGGPLLVPELELLVSQTPLRERLWEQLIVALYRGGRQGDALAAFQRARALLVDQLGVEPGPALQAVHSAVLDQKSTLHEDPPWPSTALVVHPDAQAAPLVGQVQQRAAIAQAWDYAVSGSGRVTVICGPKGAGKTSLVSELLRDAKGAAVFGASPTPNGDAVDALASLLFGTDAAALLKTPLAPDLSATALADYLTRVADRHPALAFVEDARISEETVDALRRLHVGLESHRVLVAVTSEAQPPAAIGTAPVMLAPLNSSEISELAAVVVGAEDAAQAAAAVTGVSAGWAGTVLEDLTRWAQDNAAARVAAAAGAITSSRDTVREGEQRLTDSVLTLRRLRPRTAPDDAPRCPYKGLSRFDTDDAAFFFGRERLVAQALAKMVGSGLVACVGSSGSGKSSLVRAGVIPALAEGLLPGSHEWPIAVMRPGDHPLAALGMALTSSEDPAIALADFVLGGGVLVVDQLEEAFTACLDDGERAAFFAALTTAAEGSGDHAGVVVTVRADFVGRFASYRELARLLSDGQVLVGPMDATEMRRAVEIPAHAAGLEIEPALVDALLDDTIGQGGALPLLSSALLELWQRRRGGALTLLSYEAMGRVEGSVARLGEDAYARLDPDEQQAARMVLLRLADAGAHGSTTPVRRRVPLTEIEASRPEVRSALEAFTDQRLLTVAESSVEVAHEALLREWPRLRAWLDEDVEGRRIHQHLARSATEWQESSAESSALYRGARLAGALEWAGLHDAEMSDIERAFLDASRRASEAEADAARRSNRRLRALVTGVAMLLVLALIAAGVAGVERNRSSRAAEVADARRLAAQALLEPQLDRSLLLAVEAARMHHSADTRGAVLASQSRSPQAAQILRGDGDRLLDVAVAPDGRTVVLGDNDGTVTFWDSGSPAHDISNVQVPGSLSINHVVFSRDGRLMATDATGGAISIWDVARREITATTSDFEGQPAFVWAFEPGGTTLLVGTGSGDVLRWDIERNRVTGGPLFTLPGGADWLDVAADGKHVLAATLPGPGEATVVWERETGRVIRRIPQAGPAALSPDGRTIALGGTEGQVALWDVATGRQREVRGRHGGALIHVAFSHDGRLLTSASDDRTAAVWETDSGERLHQLSGHAGKVTGAAFSRDARSLYTGGLDATAIAWDLVGESRLDHAVAPAEAPPPGVLAVAGLSQSADGSTLAVPRTDGQLDFHDAADGSLIRSVALPSPVYSAAFAADDSVAVGGEGGVWVVPPDGEGEPAAVPELKGATNAVARTADGTLLAAGGSEGPLKILDTRNNVVETISVDAPIGVAAFNHDGSRIAVGDGRGGVTLFDVETSERLASATVDESEVWSLAFSPDDETLATGGGAGQISLLDTTDLTPTGPRLEGLAGLALGVSFNSDEELLAASSSNGTVVVFDVASGRVLGSPLEGPDNFWITAVFHPRDDAVSAVSQNGTLLRWDLDAAGLLERACQVAGRSLTREEWDQALPEQAYAPSCVDGALR